MTVGNKKERDLVYCQFCGRDENEVFLMIAGPVITSMICDFCIEACREIVDAERARRTQPVEGSLQ